MITITYLTKNKQRCSICLGYNINHLWEMLMVLEECDRVDQYKISREEGLLVTSLYEEFGWGELSKFVTKFDWRKE